MKKIYLFSILFGTLVSCTHQEQELSLFQENHEAITNDNLVSIDEACNLAANAIQEAFETTTRSDKQVADIESFNFPTRSDDESNLFGFYIINYENEGGYALVSADRRRTPVYALSDTGSLHLSDTLRNKGLSWYLNEHLNNPEAFATLPVTPTPTPNPMDSTIGNFTGTKTSRTVIQRPLLPVITRNMDQFYPNNAFCEPIDGNLPPVGCLPLAVGVTMSYYKWPTSIEGYDLDWDNMYTDNWNKGWPNLFEVLGRKEYLNASYGLYETSAYIYNLPRTFEKAGYTKPTYEKFKSSKAQSELKAKNPVICFGYDIDTNIGHAFILDGMFYEITCYYQNGMANIISNNEFYHCIWGDSRNTSGYYLYSNQLGGTAVEYDKFTRNDEPIYGNLGIAYGYRVNN